MSAPSSFNRVLAALKRLFPFDVTITRPAGAAPAVGDSAIGRELGTLAWMLARAADRVEVFPDELFPSTSTESIARWEKVFGVAPSPSLTIDERRNRVLSAMRRKGGTQPDRLRRMLYAVLGLTDPFDIELIETERTDIENALLVDSGVISVSSDSITYVTQWWPGFVDDTGVRIGLTFSAIGTPVATITSPSGTTWTFNITSAAQTTYENRTAFLGEKAAGTWNLSIVDGGGVSTMVNYKLLVSNDVDSAQIYNFFAFRDPMLPGTPDIAEAQRLFNRSALAHMTSYVVQSITFLCDDPYSLMDRDPFGG